MSAELKPCPFCGGRPEIGAIDVPTEYWISCKNGKCEINPQTAPYKELEEAIDAWNKRAEVKNED